MWWDGKVSAPGRGGSTLQKLSKVITQRNATCQGNLDDSSLPGLLQAKLQSSPFLTGRAKIQSHITETSDAVCYFQTQTCAWIQTHAAKDRKKLWTNTGSCQWVISASLWSPSQALCWAFPACSSIWPHPASHRMMLSYITRKTLEHALALQLQELSHQTNLLKAPNQKNPKSLSQASPQNKLLFKTKALLGSFIWNVCFLHYTPYNISLLTAPQHVLIISTLCCGF